jgi:DNA repair exonuclease SbcCD ATPase subunit
LGDITRFDALEAAFKDDKERRIEAVLTRFAEHETRLAALTDDLAQDIELTDETAVRDRSRTFSASHHTAREWLATASAEHKMIYDTIQFLARHTTCPTCGQAITAEHSTAYAHAVRPRLAELAHTCEISKLDIATTEAEISGAEITLRQAVASNERKKSERAAQQREARHLTELLADLERQAVAIDAEENPHAAERCRVAAERARLDAARHTAQTAEAMLVSEVAALDFWRQGFRRVRLFCLERVLGELTIETRNSLLELGLRDWEITFTATTESKSGVVRLGVQTEMTGPNADCKFDMISGGEGQRARLATSLGFANLVQRHAGVVFNLEVFDEPTAWLSEQGVEDLLECLHARALAKNRAIYICDHRSLQHTGFSKILRIIKDDRGSRLAN